MKPIDGLQHELCPNLAKYNDCRDKGFLGMGTDIVLVYICGLSINNRPEGDKPCTKWDWENKCPLNKDKS